jgi:hypothetical protein
MLEPRTSDSISSPDCLSNGASAVADASMKSRAIRLP